jgi:SecD/SecF fusion protein
MVLDQIQPPQPLSVLKSRLRAMRLQPGFESHGWRESDVFGLTPSAPGSENYSRAMVVVADENYPLLDEQGGLSSAWVTDLAEPEVKLLQTALQRQTSLSQITQFDKQISGEAQTNAYIAIVLSWFMIVIYLWFRFGNLRWGLAAVVALVHDVLVALGAIGLAHHVFDTPLGHWLMIDKFRIDMTLLQRVVIGYSVNDTIIVFDRIRENRGRQKDVTPEIIDLSISQTLARTLLTVLTVLLTVIIMYIFGGRGIHGFNYALFVGIMTGTYSSFAIAGQLLVKRKVAALARVG